MSCLAFSHITVSCTIPPRLARGIRDTDCHCAGKPVKKNLPLIQIRETLVCVMSVMNKFLDRFDVKNMSLTEVG